MGLGVARPDERLFAEVMRRYAEPHRSYHTTLHLDECFAKLDEARQHADRLYEIELALWFHDAVYGRARLRQRRTECVLGTGCRVGGGARHHGRRSGAGSDSGNQARRVAAGR
jgi:hypothetical protein